MATVVAGSPLHALTSPYVIPTSENSIELLLLRYCHLSPNSLQTSPAFTCHRPLCSGTTCSLAGRRLGPGTCFYLWMAAVPRKEGIPKHRKGLPTLCQNQGWMSVVVKEAASNWNCHSGHLRGKRLKIDCFCENKLELKIQGQYLVFTPVEEAELWQTEIVASCKHYIGKSRSWHVHRRLTSCPLLPFDQLYKAVFCQGVSWSRVQYSFRAS